jgi:hypothetical protein
MEFDQQQGKGVLGDEQTPLGRLNLGINLAPYGIGPNGPGNLTEYRLDARIRAASDRSAGSSQPAP